MKNQSLRSHFGAVTFAFLSVAVVMGCTKKKELKNEVDPNAYMAKTALVNSSGKGKVSSASASGKYFHLSRGVEEADSDNDVDATPGMSDDFGIVQARITEKELQFISVFDPRGREATNKIVASYPITDHFDIERETNDFGEQTHKIVENRDKPWNQRAYIRVDWQSPSNTLSKFAEGLGQGKWIEAEENTTLLETPTVSEDGYINFLVETSLKTRQKTTFTFPYSYESTAAYRVVYRTHLMPVKENGFEGVKYTLEDFQKFGYFYTQQNFENPEKGLQEKDVQLYANVHNVCEKGNPAPCSKNQIKWVFSKDFPEFYKEEARKAVSAWNDTFRAALNRDGKDDAAVVVLDESVEANISDPRYNILAFYPERTNAGLLGVAQWVSDPRNGELVGVRATVYQDGINGTLGQIDTLIDLLKSKDPISDVIKTNPLGTDSSYASPYNGSTAKNDALQARVLGINKIKNSRYRPGSPAEAVAAAMNRMDGGPEKANARLATYVSKLPGEMTAIEEANLLKTDEVNPNLLPFPTKTGGVTIPNLNGMERLIFANEQIKSEKAKRLSDAKRGIHGSELVAEAAVRYLLNLLGKGATIEQLDQNRQKIKDLIAKETYYSTLLHEMGHAFGLRHNFRGSSDKAHYPAKYFQLAKDLENKKNGVTKADLDAFAMSSIMDYGHDFYSDGGGLGTYDAAAIKYAYNRSINRDTDPVVKANYAFCTDHEVDETILCRRFDKGSNVSEITQANVDMYNRSYPLMHYRRGRISQGNYNGWGNPNALVGSLLSRFFIPTRQVMDEFLYMVIGGEKVPPAERTGSYCDFKFVKDSIKAGEMASICSSTEMERAGVDPTDMETFVNALFGPDGKPLKTADQYIPYGMADLLWSNRIAKNFFAEIMATTEPGRYLALPDQKDQTQPFSLIKMPAAATEDDSLAMLARENGIEDLEAFNKNYKQFVVEIPISRDARELETVTSRTGGYTKTEILGSWWDKYAAIIALSTRDLGVEKYYHASMSTNVYFAPQSKKFGAALFGKVINRKASGNVMKAITVTLKNRPKKEVVAALSDAALNLDLQSLAGIYAIGAMTTSSDMSMLNKLRICTTGEGGCEAGENKLPVVQFAANGKTYRAVQTYEEDSIAYEIVKAAKTYSDQRAAAEKAKASTDDKHADAIMALNTAGELRTRLDSTIAKYPDLQELRDLITDNTKPQSAWAFIEFVTKNLKNVPYFSLQEKGTSLKELFKAATAFVDNAIAETSGVPVATAQPGVPMNPGANKFGVPQVPGAPQAPIAVPNAKQLTDAEKARLADLKQIKADLKEAVTLIETIIDSSIEARRAPITIKQSTSQLERVESSIIMLRKLLKQEED